MTCREAIASVLDLIEGTLGPDERRALERHVAHCAWCQRLVSTYKVTVRVCGHVERQHTPKAEALPSLLAWLRPRCQNRRPST